MLLTVWHCMLKESFFFFKRVEYCHHKNKVEDDFRINCLQAEQLYNVLYCHSKPTFLYIKLHKGKLLWHGI